MAYRIIFILLILVVGCKTNNVLIEEGKYHKLYRDKNGFIIIELKETIDTAWRADSVWRKSQ